MKILFICLSFFLLCSCASTSEVKDIEQLVVEGRETVAELDNKIALLEVDRIKLSKQLESIDSNGQSLMSEATDLKGKISTIDQSIDSYKKEIKKINSKMTKKHSKYISC